MVYSLDDDGIFRPEDLNVPDGDSVHFHGPSRAAGVLKLGEIVRQGDCHRRG